MRLIVAGCRRFTNYQWLESELNSILRANAPPHTSNHAIISGGAKGADTLGERYAFLHGIPLERFPAQWSKYRKAAGPIRNRQMAQSADTLALFWDLKSRGSASMLSEARKHNLQIFQFDIENHCARPQASYSFL